MPKRKIGAFWRRKTKEGGEYFTGVITDLRGDIQIVVFKNDKKAENQPDYDNFAVRAEGGEIAKALRLYGHAG